MIADTKDEFNVNAANPFFMFASGSLSGLRGLGDMYPHQSVVPQPVQPTVGNKDWLDYLDEILPVIGLAGISDSGLGCGGDCSCSCGNKKGISGLGIVAPENIQTLSPTPGPNQVSSAWIDWNGLWTSGFCNTVGGNVGTWAGLWCTPPTNQQVINDTSNYGVNLSPDAQKMAEDIAGQYIPTNPPTDYEPYLWIAGAGAILLLLVKK